MRRNMDWVKCSVLCVGYALLGCRGDDGATNNGQTPSPAASGCMVGQSSACTGASCADGNPANAVCLEGGTWGECTCADGSSPGGSVTPPTMPDPTTGAGTGGTGGGSGTAAQGSSGAGGTGTVNPMGGTGGGDPPATDSGVWAQMGYDVKNQYYNPLETTLSPANAADIQLKWSFPIAGYPPGTPAIAEGKVFVTATGGVYAIDLESGEEVWSRTDLRSQSSAAYGDGAIYVHTQPADLYKLNAADGTTVWGPVRTNDHASADGTSSAILIGDFVVVGHSTSAEIFGGHEMARGGVVAFDTETGEQAWRYYTVELPENGAMVWSSVSADLEAGVVYASAGNNYSIAGPGSDAIHAIDLASGARSWVTQVRENDIWSFGGNPLGPDTDFGANPIILDYEGQKLVAAGDKNSDFWAMNRETGEIVWSRTALSSSHTPQNGGVLNNGAFDGTYFYVISNQPPNQSVLHALDPAQMGASAWSHTFNKITWGMPSAANGLAVVPVDDELHIYDAAGGELLNMFSTGGSIAAGAAAIADGKIVVQSGLEYPLGNPTPNNQIHCYGL